MHLALGRGAHDSGQGMPDPLRETGYSGVSDWSDETPGGLGSGNSKETGDAW